MLYAKYILKDRILKITNLSNNLKGKNIDIDNERRKLYGFIYDIQLALEECLIASKYNKQMFHTLKMQMKSIHKSITSMNTVDDLMSVYDSLTEAFAYFDYTNDEALSYSYEALRELDFIGDEPIFPLKNLAMQYNRNINLFEPNCGSGDTFKIMGTSALCYGNENSYLVKDAKKCCERVVRTSLSDMKISNDVFDMCVMKCNIGLTLESNLGYNNSFAKVEKKFLVNMSKYIRNEGAVLIVIPAFRMYKDVCEHIAKYYTNVQVFKSRQHLWEDKRLLCIYGQKSLNKEKDMDIYKKLRKLFDTSDLQEISADLQLDYKLAPDYRPVLLFRGSTIDQEELQHIVETSSCEDEFMNTREVLKLGEQKIEPLLPFNIGQLGLVLTSGCLDGVVDEGDGHYHLVKGMVSKKSDKDTSKEGRKQIESEIISNRVEINIMLPNGDFKKLT